MSTPPPPPPAPAEPPVAATKAKTREIEPIILHSRASLPVAQAVAILSGLKKIPQSKGCNPILNCVLFNAAGMMSTNLDMGAIHPIDDAPARSRGFAIPIEQLIRFLEGADKDATLSLDARLFVSPPGSNRVTYAVVKATTVKRGVVMTADISGHLEEEFPALPSGPESVPQLWDGLTQSALEQSIPFASTDETRHIMNSVFVDPANGAIVATDGRRINVFNGFTWRNLKESFILPIGSLKYLLALTARKEGQVWRVSVFKSGETRRILQASIGQWHVVAKLEDGTYPNYKQVIPRAGGPGGTAAFSPVEAKRLAEIIPLMPPLDLASTKDEAKRPILITVNGDLSFTLGNNKVVADAATTYTPPPVTLPRPPAEKPKADAPPGEEPVAAEPIAEATPPPEPPPVAAQRGYVFVTAAENFIIDALGTCQNGMTELHVTDELCPVVLRGPGRLHVLMPLRTT